MAACTPTAARKRTFPNFTCWPRGDVTTFFVHIRFDRPSPPFRVFGDLPRWWLNFVIRIAAVEVGKVDCELIADDDLVQQRSPTCIRLATCHHPEAYWLAT